MDCFSVIDEGVLKEKKIIFFTLNETMYVSPMMELATILWAKRMLITLSKLDNHPFI